MTPKVKAQKTRLSNYLVKELGAKLVKSLSTESEYFTIGDIKIRISDHTSGHNNKLSILIPFNDPNSFIIESNYIISILHSLKEVKAFLHSLLFAQRLYQESLGGNVMSKLSEAQEEMSKLKESIYLLKTRNVELESMVGTRNKAIAELAERAKAAEELALSDPQNVVEKRATILNIGDIAEDAVVIQGKAYSLRSFPGNFRRKLTNVILNTGKLIPLCSNK